MLIGIDASRYGYETATGVERYSFYIINGLIEKISAQTDAQNEDKIILYSRGEIKLPKNLKYDPEKVIFKPIKRKRLWTRVGLSREMRKNPPDVLFVPSHTLPRRFPKKSVITIHDVAFKHFKRSYSFFQYLHLDWSAKFAVKNASKIIVPSESTKKDLMHFYKCDPEKIQVIYHGYEPLPELHMSSDQEEKILKQFWLKKESKFIFFIGRLETKKNIENLIKAFSIFAAAHPKWKLILGGKRGVGFNRIQKISDKIGVWGNIMMPGYIKDVEKYVLFKYCKFFAFPSFYEGFGFPILEAFSHGKPVLTSKVSSIPEVAGEGALYTDPFDTEMMAKDMEKLATDENLQVNLARETALQLKNFDWDKTVDQTYECLK